MDCLVLDKNLNQQVKIIHFTLIPWSFFFGLFLNLIVFFGFAFVLTLCFFTVDLPLWF